MVSVEAIARLAGAQHGVVARWQLAAIGVSKDVVNGLVRAGYLLQLHRGVFAAGHVPRTDQSRLMAGALAAGADALIAYRCAAFTHGFAGSMQLGWIDVLLPRGRGGFRHGIRFHHTRLLLPEDATQVDGIPATSVARTLRDLAAVETPERLRHLLGEADRLGCLDRDALAEILERSRGHRGIRTLKALFERYAHPPPFTRSPLEYRFFRLWERTGLPMPEFNVRVAGYEVDCLWRSERLIVELDGYAYHHTDIAASRDQAKDEALVAAGYRVLHFTYAHVVERPDWVVDQIRLALSAPVLP